MGFGNEITGGQGALLRTAIKSPNYVPGVSGWSINRDGTSEFSGGQFRGAVIVGVPPNPNIQITTTIPASLIAATVPGIYSTIYTGTFYFFNATDFYYEILAQTGISPVLARGSLVGGVLTTFETYSGPGGLNTFVNYGDNNTSKTTWQYIHGDFDMTETANFFRTDPSGIAGSLSVPYPPVETALLGKTAARTISSAGAETVFANADYEPFQINHTFLNNHVFRIDVEIGVFANVAAVNNSINLKIRQGSATTTGQILHSVSFCVNTTVLDQKRTTGWFRNVTGAPITTDLSLTCIRDAGANTVNLRGDTTRWAQITLWDYNDNNTSIARFLARDMV